MINQRKLVVSIEELFDIPTDLDEQVDEKYKGTLPTMPTALSVNYTRKTVGGLRCDEPLNPVYMEALIEALAYVASLTANQPEQVPLLAGLMLGRLSQRVQVYGKAKFPGFVDSLRGGLAGVIAAPDMYNEKRDAFLEYFTMQLNGEKDPCGVCDKKECKFRGAFDAPTVATKPVRRKKKEAK